MSIHVKVNVRNDGAYRWVTATVSDGMGANDKAANSAASSERVDRHIARVGTAWTDAGTDAVAAAIKSATTKAIDDAKRDLAAALSALS